MVLTDEYFYDDFIISIRLRFSETLIFHFTESRSAQIEKVMSFSQKFTLLLCELDVVSQ